MLKEFHKHKLEELKDEAKPPVHSASGNTREKKERSVYVTQYSDSGGY